MNEQKQSVDKFFDSLPSEEKMFEEETKAAVPEKNLEKGSEEKKGGDDKKEDDEYDGPKNRHMRRLEQKLQRERESNIALTERIKAQSEFSKLREEFKSEGLDDRLLELFGTNDQGKRAAKLFQEMRLEDRQAAKDEALREIEERNKQAQTEQRQYEEMIDSELEGLEDQFDVDLTSNAPAARKARKEFLELVQELSPKNENGELTDYADFGKTFELYQRSRTTEKSSADTTKAKEIASRSMVRPGTGSSATKRPTPGFRGWETDFGI